MLTADKHQFKAGNRVCSHTIPTTEGQRQTVTPRVGTFFGEQVSPETQPETQAIMAIVKWDGHPGESLVPPETLQRVVPVREQLSPELQLRCNAALESYDEVMLITVNGQIKLGSEFSAVLAQFMEERGKRKGKQDFWCWLREEMGLAAYFIEMAIEWYGWWQKLAPRVQEFLKKHPLKWGKAVYRALMKVTGVSIAMLKMLLAREKTTAKDVKGISEFYAELIPGAEVLVLNCPEKPEYVGRQGLVETEPTEDNLIYIKMGTGEVLTVSVEWIVPTSQIVSDAGWEDLGATHGLSAVEIEQVKQEAMSLATRETQPGHYLIVKRSQLQATLKKLGILPVKKQGREPAPARPESKLYSSEQIEQLRQQERKDAIEQYKQEQLENNIRIQGEIREAALEQAAKENEAAYAHREKLMVEKEELRGAVVERDNLIAEQSREIEELYDRLQLKESATERDSIGSTSRSVEIEELRGAVVERDTRIARLGTELEELRSTVLKLQETQSGSTSNQGQDSIPSSAPSSASAQNSSVEEEGKLFFTKEEVEAKIEKARAEWERARFEAQQSEIARLRDEIENEVTIKVMVLFWAARDKMVDENKKLQESVLETERKLEQTRFSATSLRNLTNELSKEKELVEEQKCSLEKELASKEAYIASLINKSGLVDSELHEGKRVVVRTASKACKGALGTVQSQWKGAWWVLLDSVAREGGTQQDLFKASELGEESEVAVFTLEEVRQHIQELQGIWENQANKQNLTLQQKLKESTENGISLKKTMQNVEKVTSQLGEVLGNVRIPGWNCKGYRASNGLVCGGLAALQAFVEDVLGGRIDLETPF